MHKSYPLKEGHTEKEQTAGSKQVKAQFLRPGQPSDIGFTPPSRVFTRDYRVPDEDDKTNQDTVGPFVGNPLIW